MDLGATENIEPIPFTPYVAERHLEQAARAVVRDQLLRDAARTPDLVAVLAVEQILQRIQAVVGPWCSRVEGPVVFVLARARRRAVLVLRVARWVGARALDVCVWLEWCHCDER
jgi:hypothetical protein